MRLFVFVLNYSINPMWLDSKHHVYMLNPAWPVLSVEVLCHLAPHPYLVPDAPCSMVWDCLLASSLLLFHTVVEEEIDQYSVDMGIGVLPLNLAPNQLDTPDAASCYVLVSVVSSRLRTVHLPRSCTSHADPLSIIFLSLIAVAIPGQQYSAPREIRIWGMR